MVGSLGLMLRVWMLDCLLAYLLACLLGAVIEDAQGEGRCDVRGFCLL